MPENDEVDRIVAAWQRAHPELDFSPLQVLLRVARLSKHLDRARRDAFASSGLEPWEFDVLAALRREGSPFQASPKSLLQQTRQKLLDAFDNHGYTLILTQSGAPLA